MRPLETKEPKSADHKETRMSDNHFTHIWFDECKKYDVVVNEVSENRYKFSVLNTDKFLLFITPIGNDWINRMIK